MKDSGIEWIGEIPDDWEMVLLSSIFHQHKEKNSRLQETNLLSLSYGKIITKDIETREGLLPASFDTYNIIDNGDIVFRLTDLQNDQRSLRTGLCTQKGIITSAYITLRKNVYLESRYMHYLFHSYDICKVFYGMGDGVRQGMGFDDLKKLLVLFPSLQKQQQIADFLDKKCAEIDRLIAHEEAMIDELKAYKQSVITEAVTKGLDRTAPMKNSGVEWIGEIPAAWSCSKIKFHFLTISGNGFSDGLQGLECGDYPFCKASDISEAGKTLTTARNYITKETAEQNHFNIIPERSILFAKIGEAMKKNHRALCECKCCIDNNCQALLPVNGTNAVYAYYLTKCIDMAWFDNAGTVPCVNVKKLMDSFMPCPSQNEQQQIADYLDKKCAEIDRLISLKQEKIAGLREYKKSLIYEYVTGKKEVV